MTRTAQLPPLLRLAAAAVAAVAVLPLSGCLYGQIPADQPSLEEPSSAPAPDTEPSDAPADEEPGGLPPTLGFAEGAQLPATAHIEWGDGLMMDDAWTTVAPDDGNGGWTYGTLDGTCTAQFWQGHITDVPIVEGDDSASSDAMLGVLLQASAAEITPLATTGEFSYQVGGAAGVENRQVTGQQDSRTWIMAARAFTQTGVGLYVIVDCTGGDVNAAMAEVVDKNAVVVLP